MLFLINLFMKIIPLSLPTPFYVGDVNVYLIKSDPLTLIDVGTAGGWSGGLWMFFSTGLQIWVVVMLALAVLLTVYSLIDYLWSYRTVVGIRD